MRFLSTRILTNIVSIEITRKVIPEVVSEHREEEVMHLLHNKAVLSMDVVGLSLSPVKPLNRSILVSPSPVSRLVLIMSVLKIFFR